MNTRRLFSHYAGGLTALMLPILVLPFYFRYLGSNQWSFFAVILLIQAISLAIEAGVSQVNSKDVAALRSKDHKELTNALRPIHTLYTWFCFSIILIISAISTPLAQKWEYSGIGNTFQIELICLLILGGVYAALSVYNSFLKSILLGLDKYSELNSANILFTSVRLLFGAALAILTRNVGTVIFWYVGTMLAEIHYRRWQVSPYAQLAIFHRSRPSREAIQRLAKYSVGVAIGGMLTHIDKLVAGYLLPSQDFGKYTIASSLAIAAVQLVYPITNTFLPKLSYCRVEAEIKQLNIKFLYIVFSIILIFGVSYLIFGMYTLEKAFPDMPWGVMAPTLAMLLFGSAFNATANIVHLNLIVTGALRILLLLNFIGVGIAVITSIVAIKYSGIAGAGAGWMVANLSILLGGAIWLKKSGRI